VLLLSIDGMHALDFANCSSGFGNNGTSYCPNLATLGQTGVNYVDTSTSKPSDSFPGLMAIVTGGSPRTVGAYYDVAYDRVLAPPQNTTGNGVLGGTCTPNTNNGTRTEYEEGIDIDQSKLNGGASSGDGGLNSIDSTRLPRDPNNNCQPVFPQNFIRTNTIFGVIHAAHGYTAWADKHPAYIAVAGPGDGTNVDDFYGPEINSQSANFVEDFPDNVLSCNPLPDQVSVKAGDDYTGSFQNIQCYDSIKVQAILNQIDGKTHDGTVQAQVPEIFGMNFQAVSVGQKLIYTDATSLPAPYSLQGGYLDAFGTPSPSLLQEIKFVDTSIGLMVSELQKQNLLDSTLIIITAKHGQSPIDINRLLRIPADNNGQPPSAILGSAFLPDSELNQIGPTEDDVSLLWLTDSTKTSAAVEELETASPVTNNIAGIGEIFAGSSLALLYNTPGVPPNGDSRTPDIIITPNIGVVYTGGKKKVAEHGGFAHDDTNVMLLISNPSFSNATVDTTVETAQIAPTILLALGLDPNSLQAVQKEGTQPLPGLDMKVKDFK
jgi:type I phosphodiesterase/nucleotide pyrophosphatase